MEQLAASFDLDIASYAVIVGSFLAAVSNAAFSSGGAMIILAVTSSVLPVWAVVPIHSTLLIGSTASRALVFREYVAWRIAGPFLFGSALAVALASPLFFERPETAIAIASATVMLVAIWLPAVRWRPRIRHPWAVVGFVHSFLSTLFAYGALLHAVILHTGLARRQIVGTMAAALTGMSLFKILGYSLNGFDYRPFFATITLSIFAAFAGTWVGKHIIDRISESTFRFAFRALVTATAIRLLYVTIANS
jgi:uncharacterized membrane protein YfcA